MDAVGHFFHSIPFDLIVIQTVNGIVAGMILALIASGLTLIFGIMDVVNFAHGELFMLGAYMGVIVVAATGNFWLGLVASALAFVLGFSAVFIAFGASASAVGGFLQSHKSTLAPIAGALILLFGLHLLGHWARDLGAMSLAEAARRLTSHPADVLGLRHRGQIAAGFAADLLLFDPHSVGRGPKRRVHDLPAGAPRLTTDALGVHGVWVNGIQVANGTGLVDKTPLAGALLTQFAS